MYLYIYTLSKISRYDNLYKGTPQCRSSVKKGEYIVRTWRKPKTFRGIKLVQDTIDTAITGFRLV